MPFGIKHFAQGTLTWDTEQEEFIDSYSSLVCVLYYH